MQSRAWAEGLPALRQTKWGSRLTSHSRGTMHLCLDTCMHKYSPFMSQGLRVQPIRSPALVIELPMHGNAG